MSEQLDSMNYLTMDEEEELKDAGLKTMLINYVKLFIYYYISSSFCLPITRYYRGLGGL